MRFTFLFSLQGTASEVPMSLGWEREKMMLVLLCMFFLGMYLYLLMSYIAALYSVYVSNFSFVRITLESTESLGTSKHIISLRI